MKRIGTIILSALLFTTIFSIPAYSEPLDTSWHAFPNKIVFSETPEIGYKWKGGLRVKDFLVWELYWNLGDLLTADILVSGLPKLVIPGEDDTVKILEDNFLIFTLKSRPLQLGLGPVPYKIGAGMKYYASKSKIQNADSSFSLTDGDAAVAPFITQGTRLLWDYLYLNLHTSMQLRSYKRADSTTRVTTSWFIVPGCRAYIGKRKMFSFNIEYYLMNPAQFPIKTLQYALTQNNLDIDNSSQDFYSFLIYLLTFSTRRFWVDLTVGHSLYSFSPFLPFIGLGFNF